ncbi:MAG: glycosyltransferase [Candidatus Krumholzibacteriia bacterium]
MSIRPLRVLHLIEDLDVGGAERLVADLVLHPPAASRAAVACLRHRGRLGSTVARRGVPVWSLEKQGGIDIGALRRLIRLVRRERPDLIHAHVFTANLWGRLAGAFTGVPVVTTEHSTFFLERRGGVWLERALAPWTAARIVVSEDLGRAVRRKLGPRAAAHTRVVHNGIPAARFEMLEHRTGQRARIRRALGFGDGDVVVGTVSRIEPRKDHHGLLAGFARAVSESPELALVIVGDGPERGRLEDEARRRDLCSRVRFLGHRASVWRLLGAFDVFVLPSRTEGISLALLEAMGAGLACVATAVGGNPEVLAEDTGVLVPFGEPAALARVLVDLARQPGKRQRLGKRGRGRARRCFSQERMFRDIHALHRRVVSER